MFLGVSGFLQTSFPSFWMNPEPAKAPGSHLFSHLLSHLFSLASGYSCTLSPCLLQGESHRPTGSQVFFWELLGNAGSPAGILLSLPSGWRKSLWNSPSLLSSAQPLTSTDLCWVRILRRNIPQFPFPSRLWLRVVITQGVAAQNLDFGRWGVEPGIFSVLIYWEGFRG